MRLAARRRLSSGRHQGRPALPLDAKSKAIEVRNVEAAIRAAQDDAKTFKFGKHHSRLLVLLQRNLPFLREQA